MLELKALLLTQGMHGMVSQVEGLAKALGLSYKHQKIELKSFWNLIPPKITPISENLVKNKFVCDCKVIISCGRKSVIPSIALKKRLGNQIFNIHIQDPKVSFEHFDLIVSPEHDRLKGENIINTTGAIHYLTKKEINEVYTKLFNGGTAKIELVDSEDPLEAGLEMFVSPPGKRLQSITLLSGGEQALTALSLVFAVFLVNPSPICVLDEVDAPLDDANVTRFCGLLDDLTKITNTKFIIITHHALTMSRMDRLYGVTMAEQGVSQLVSVDLQRAEELVA